MSIFFAKFGEKFLVISNWLLIISQLDLIFTHIIGVVLRETNNYWPITSNYVTQWMNLKYLPDLIP